MKKEDNIEKQSIEISFNKLEPLSKVLSHLEEILSGKGVYDNKIVKVKLSLYY